MENLRLTQGYAQNPPLDQLRERSVTFNLTSHKICGFGIYFNVSANSYIVFADIIVSAAGTPRNCADSDFVFTPAPVLLLPNLRSEDIILDTIQLSQHIVFDAATSNLIYAVFQPPYLEVFLNGKRINPVTGLPESFDSQAQITLFYVGAPGLVKEIYVNNVGQISLLTK